MRTEDVPNPRLLFSISIGVLPIQNPGQSPLPGGFVSYPVFTWLNLSGVFISKDLLCILHPFLFSSGMHNTASFKISLWKETVFCVKLCADEHKAFCNSVVSLDNPSSLDVLVPIWCLPDTQYFVILSSWQSHDVCTVNLNTSLQMRTTSQRGWAKCPKLPSREEL